MLYVTIETIIRAQLLQGKLLTRTRHMIVNHFYVHLRYPCYLLPITSFEIFRGASRNDIFSNFLLNESIIKTKCDSYQIWF